ncbi:cell division protein DivIVA [Lottiidibacillus patelloidae]|uniref:Cell cycle protein GpsB n=1 Tax=Lottiidibacillus patelloidae TaxID=2670334 RepID=A0A263BVX9_9BACI|nr:cell division regulator GpsB [Lottiidibacillus patelloidae]OZM57326.1 cell division protein DivIVA [Lottiidibacillus patelloidae]
MKTGNIELTAKDILEKDFKTSIRGYNQDEVDQYLDLVIKDYETLHQEISRLEQENLRLKKEIEQGSKVEATTKHVGTTNYDILKRLSNLERHVFGSKLDNN